MTTSLENAEVCCKTQSAADSTNHQLDESTMKSPKNRELTIDLNLITQRSDAANFGPERGYPPPQQPGKEKRKSKLNKKSRRDATSILRRFASCDTTICIVRKRKFCLHNPKSQFTSYPFFPIILPW